MKILEVKNLSKSFCVHHLGREIVAFNNVNFTLNEGEFLLISGVNGVGKSTLLRCLYRTYLPTAGQVLYTSSFGVIDLARAADVDVSQLRKTDLGHVTQFLRPRPRVSALELAAEPLVMAGQTWDEAKREASNWLDRFGVKSDIWNAYPTTFSGGEQQKVNLVRALISPRHLLLLDEPTASLDQQTSQALVHTLSHLKEQGVAMIGVFHHPEDVETLIDGELKLSPPSAVEVDEKGPAYVA